MLDKWLPDDTLLKLANEIGLPETAFLVANHIRWFTPKVEVPLCGHATLATAFVLKTINKAPATSFKFHSLSGELTVSCHSSSFTLDFPQVPASLNPTIKPSLETALNIDIEEVWQSHDRYTCFVADPNKVIDYQPDFNAITQLPLPAAPIRGSAVYRHGDLANKLLSNERIDKSLVCECEAVTAGEVRYAVNSLTVNNLLDLRRRTRVGMGTCQGELCACRAAGLLNRLQVTTPHGSEQQLAHFLNERWKGIRPIAWGNALRESEFTSWVYQGLCGLDADMIDKTASVEADDEI